MPVLLYLVYFQGLKKKLVLCLGSSLPYLALAVFCWACDTVKIDIKEMILVFRSWKALLSVREVSACSRTDSLLEYKVK